MIILQYTVLTLLLKISQTLAEGQKYVPILFRLSGRQSPIISLLSTAMLG